MMWRAGDCVRCLGDNSAILGPDRALAGRRYRIEAVGAAGGLPVLAFVELSTGMFWARHFEPAEDEAMRRLTELAALACAVDPPRGRA